MNLENYPNVNHWYEKCKTIKGWDENDAGAQIFGGTVKKNLEEPLWVWKRETSLTLPFPIWFRNVCKRTNGR